MDARYKPGKGFEEDRRDPLADIELTDTNELWLIQWPFNQLKPSDLQGVEIPLKLHHDGNLGSFETPSGKSYDVVSFASQKPDATVFLPSASGTKVVGKISRRVSLVRYPEADEYVKPTFGSLSSQKSGGSWRKGLSRRSGSNLKHGTSNGTDGISSATLTHVTGQDSEYQHKSSRHRKRDDVGASSGVSSLGLEQSSEEKSRKKRK